MLFNYLSWSYKLIFYICKTNIAYYFSIRFLSCVSVIYFIQLSMYFLNYVSSNIMICFNSDRLLSLYLFNISVILLRFFLILNCNVCLFLYLFLLFFRNLVNINFYAIVIGVFICVQHVTVSIKVIILMFRVR